MNQNAQSVSITAPALIYSQETKIHDMVNWQLAELNRIKPTCKVKILPLISTCLGHISSETYLK